LHWLAPDWPSVDLEFAANSNIGHAAQLSAIIFGMRLLRLHKSSQSHYAWLLCLALMLPLAQVTATVHSLMHVQLSGSVSTDAKPALSADHCNLCLSSQTVMGGAPLVQAVGSTVIVTRFALPPPNSTSFEKPRATRPYQSRAPPSL
jgi:hypothetical protein